MFDRADYALLAGQLFAHSRYFISSALALVNQSLTQGGIYYRPALEGVRDYVFAQNENNIFHLAPHAACFASIRFAQRSALIRVS